MLRGVYTVTLAILLLAPTIYLFFAPPYCTVHPSTIAGTYRPPAYCTFARTVHPIESLHTHTAWLTTLRSLLSFPKSLFLLTLWRALEFPLLLLYESFPRPVLNYGAPFSLP